MDRLLSLCLVVFLVPAAVGAAETTTPSDAHAGHSLGKVSFPISCAPEEQPEFNRAVALLHHMTYPGARAAVEQAPSRVTYLIYGYLQKGQDEDAAKQLARLRDTANLEPSFKTAFHLASTQARYALERRAWEEAAQVVPRESKLVDWDRFAWPEAISRFAQGFGLAHLGKVEEAEADGQRLTE